MKGILKTMTVRWRRKVASALLSAQCVWTDISYCNAAILVVFLPPFPAHTISVPCIFLLLVFSCWVLYITRQRICCLLRDLQAVSPARIGISQLEWLSVHAAMMRISGTYYLLKATTMVASHQQRPLGRWHLQSSQPNPQLHYRPE